MASIATDIAPIPVDQFSTDLKAICGRFQVAPMRKQRQISSGLGLCSMAGIEAAVVTQNAKRIERTALDIRRDPGENFFLIWQQKGNATLVQNGAPQRMVVGDMFVVDSSIPSQFHYEGQLSTQISLHLPREEQVHRFGRRIGGGVHVPSTDPLGQAMRSILTSSMVEDTQPHITEAFYSVFGAFLMNRALGAKSAPDPRRILVQRAAEVMSQNFREPDFGVADVARKLNASPRHLQRAFRFVGDTMQGRLLHMRLDAARKKLRDPQARTVAEVAFASGFSDLSTFHRQYKSRFETVPSADLKRRRAMQ